MYPLCYIIGFSDQAIQDPGNIMESPHPLFSYRPYWAKRFGVANVLPTTAEEMANLGWDACDIILVTGDAYVDHPSFGMAVIGRTLEAQGFRVGIIDQPDWTSEQDFMRLGQPTLFFGITSGNMDSMVNRYTADRKVRSNDAYSPDSQSNTRPDRAVIVYSQRCRQAYKKTPIIVGGIEASLRRVAHYDYWSDTVRRSVLMDSKADMLVYGNGERQIVEIAHRLASKENIKDLCDIRGTAFIRPNIPQDWHILDRSHTDANSRHQAIDSLANPYAINAAACEQKQKTVSVEAPKSSKHQGRHSFAKTVLVMPAFNKVKSDKTLYAHASRLLHRETNPGNALALFQPHGNRGVWLNPPALPLSSKELDQVFELPYTRLPHPRYAEKSIPAYEMIRFSINIMRGCFGGCTFCSITEHEGRVIQNRSEDSILREIETIRDNIPGFTGVISDLGGPTANMYRLACKDKTIEQNCRLPSCVYPDVCKNLDTNHKPLIKLYQRARQLPGIKKILIASGLRYDLAIKSPQYIKELVSHHVGGYLKIAPEHTQPGPLSKMLKPGIGTYDQFKALFDKYSREAGKEQYLIPYFIAAHPGTSDEDMLQLALWLKQNDYRADQVQTFLPSPMATASAMYYTELNPLEKISTDSKSITVPKGLKVRRLHKAFLRYHAAENWPLLRDALKRLGREDLIGNAKWQLVPNWQPSPGNAKTKPSHSNTFRTQHAGEIPTPASRSKNQGKKKTLRKSKTRLKKSSRRRHG